MNLQIQKQRLLKMLAEVEAVTNEDGSENLRDYSHELTVFDNHPADVATDNYTRNMDAAFSANNEHVAGQIRLALERIESGEYFTCSSCHRPIDAERLQALPYASTCLRCSDNELGGSGKPVSEPAYSTGFTWPKFETYGTSDSVQEQPRQEE
ncbi:MAG: hypothetical protein FH749_05910 [Firmicutes bacterium]|nr:hypothetical protein [Bacillota bacterium]